MNPTLRPNHEQTRIDLSRTLRGWAASILFGGALLGALGMNISCGGGSDQPSSPAPAPTPPITPTTGMVTGQVKSMGNGQGISGATVTDGTATASTFADGTYTLVVSPADRKRIIVTAPGFGETQQITRIAAGGRSEVDAFLVPSTIIQIDSLASGATLTVPDSTAQVVLPVNGLVTTGGLVPSFPVQASLTPLDPSNTPAVMPGDYTNDADQTIESFGAMTVTFTDSTGARLNLASGQVATIRIPLASTYMGGAPPATVPAFFYNTTAGRWIEEGVLTLGGTDLAQYYEGTVAHFSTWNADSVTDTRKITGKVVRSIGGAAVGGATVIVMGKDWVGSYKTITETDGTFTIYMKQSGTSQVTATARDVNNLPLYSVTPVIEIKPTDTTTTLTIQVEGSLKLTGTLRDFSPSRPYISAALTPAVYVYPEPKYGLTDLRPYILSG